MHLPLMSSLDVSGGVASTSTGDCKSRTTESGSSSKFLSAFTATNTFQHPHVTEDTRNSRDEKDDAVQPGPAKRPRLPRIAEACIRCKTRKQRCVKEAGAEICKNCDGAKSECIIAPRARRKNARTISQSNSPNRLSPAPRYAAPSPSSLQNLLRTDAPPSNPVSAFDAFANDSEPPRPFLTPATADSWSPSCSSSSQFANDFKKECPPLVHPNSCWPQPHGRGQTNGFNAPTSDIRSPKATEQDEQTSETFIPNVEQRPNSRGKATATGQNYQEEEARVTSEDNDGRTSENEENDQHEAAKGVAFLSLNAGGNPIYVGPSSGFSWARMVIGGMTGASRAEGGNYSPTKSKFDTRATFDSSNTQTSSSTPLLSDDALEGISDELANRIYQAVYEFVQSQFCFLDWLWLRSIFPHRVKICRAAKAQGASKATQTATFFIWMIFALGSRLLAQPIAGLASPESYYAKAMDHLETIVGLHDLKNVQALLFMVVYSFQAPSAPSTWFLAGIVTRLCCSLGLHRKLPKVQARRLSPYLLQLRRRIFWSAYAIDRMLATSLGRPISIPDEEIDIELPLDCDVESLNVRESRAVSDMTSSLHFIALSRLVSTIRKRIYRLDEFRSKEPSDLLQALDDWDARIPSIASDSTCSSAPCCTRDWFLSKSMDARLCLLRPLTADKETAKSEHLKLLALRAAEACEIQKRLHQNPVGTLSLETLRTVFLNGLTLLHSARLSPPALTPTILQRAIRSCSNTLYTYSQHFRGAATYFECFEELASLVVDPASSTPASSCNTPLFQLWEEIPSVMTHESGESFANLLDSLGVPFNDSWNQYFDATGLGNDITYSETGFNVDPFASGGSLAGGGLWQ